jgi:Mrp family chromosome partitioning ATPase
MRDFIQEAGKEYDLVVIDAPPVLPVADAQVLTSVVDAAIMVVRSGACPHDLVCGAAGLLQPKIMGLVLNGVRLHRKSYYYSYYQKAETQ